MDIDLKVAREAKAIVALALRNGPIEDLHAGKACPTCSSKPEYSRLSAAEMRQLMKYAVNRSYSVLIMREKMPEKYEMLLKWADRFTGSWDDPEMTADF